MMLPLLALLLLHDTCAAPLMGLGTHTLLDAASLRDVHYPELRPYMKHLWRQQQDHPHQPLSQVIGILPSSVLQSVDGMATIVFSDLDLSSEFDAAQLLFHGARCPNHVRVRVCASAPCHSRKMNAVLQREMLQYYVTLLKDMAGPLPAVGAVPRLEITLYMRSMYHCHVKGLLLIHYPPAQALGAADHNRVRRMAPPSPAPPSPAPPADPALCHKEAWTTTGAEIGIASLIRPVQLVVNQCVGMCTLKVEAYSNHAYIRHRYNKQRNGTVQVAEPCCVPIKVDSLPLLLTNEQDNIELKTYHDMVVEECGCI